MTYIDLNKKKRFYIFIYLYFPGTVTIGELLNNETAFVLDVQQRMSFDPAVLNLLLETDLPNNLEVSQENWTFC